MISRVAVKSAIRDFLGRNKGMDTYEQVISLLGIKNQEGKDCEEEQLQEIRAFLQGQDFLRLGHCIQGKQWHLVMNNCNRMKQHCEELGITCFDNYLKGIREAARHQNGNEALQLMSRITAKRVQIRKVLSEEFQHEIPKT